jgi:hypothetical protein
MNNRVLTYLADLVIKSRISNKHNRLNYQESDDNIY